eukprot:365682-Chlamydomonas_euryale.AAC.7
MRSVAQVSVAKALLGLGRRRCYGRSCCVHACKGAVCCAGTGVCCAGAAGGEGAGTARVVHAVCKHAKMLSVAQVQESVVQVIHLVIWSVPGQQLPHSMASCASDSENKTCRLQAGRLPARLPVGMLARAPPCVHAWAASASEALSVCVCKHASCTHAHAHMHMHTRLTHLPSSSTVSRRSQYVSQPTTAGGGLPGGGGPIPPSPRPACGVAHSDWWGCGGRGGGIDPRLARSVALRSPPRGSGGSIRPI